MKLQLRFPFTHSEEDVRQAVYRQLGGPVPFRVIKRSIDARQPHRIRVLYTITTDTRDPAEDILLAVDDQRRRFQRAVDVNTLLPLVVGSGPGGIFCSLWLHMHGVKVTMLEQGPDMRQRMRDMARFMKHGELHPWSNICFGAGGAGTYSDGKLITRIRSPLIAFVMSTFVRYGAPESIRYLYNPHLGSNKIRRCIVGLLEDMERSGVRILYNTRVIDFCIDEHGAISKLRTHDGSETPASAVFLATGHSARPIYTMLRDREVAMRAKDFAMGLRIEHPADAINQMQYGSDYIHRYPGIETAQYRLVRTWKDEGRAVYSFCMCPGGYVLNASTDVSGVVTNGMSNYMKSGRFSNAAIVSTVSAGDLEQLGYGGIDGGLALQSELEETFRASVNQPGRCNVIPGQRLSDFLESRASSSLYECSSVNPVAPAAMHSMLPDFMYNGLQRAFHVLDRKMRGFSQHPHAQVFGIESRTSSPYRIDRNVGSLVSPSLRNLYPVGEGAGYAGGITSAAVDGIRAAQAWLSRYIEPHDLFTDEAGRDIGLSMEEA
jgi:uncharacterized protein